MNKGKLRWCLSQKDGVNITEAKPHLGKSYMDEADETLKNIFSATGKWKLIMAYYSCYSAFYSILAKCCIRCEIHDCTIELMSLFEFGKEDIEYIHSLKDSRIHAQYYLKAIELDDENKVKKFILKCRLALSELNSDKIEMVRKSINQISRR